MGLSTWKPLPTSFSLSLILTLPNLLPLLIPNEALVSLPRRCHRPFDPSFLFFSSLLFLSLSPDSLSFFFPLSVAFIQLSTIVTQSHVSIWCAQKGLNKWGLAQYSLNIGIEEERGLMQGPFFHGGRTAGNDHFPQQIWVQTYLAQPLLQNGTFRFQRKCSDRWQAISCKNRNFARIKRSLILG